MAAAAVSVTLFIAGDKNSVRNMLDHLDSCFSAQGMTEFFGTAVVPYLRMRAGERFAQEGDNASGKWAPLAPATIDYREAGIASGEFRGISGAHPINRRSGSMEEYITQGVGEVITEGRSSSILYYPKRTVPARNTLSKKVRYAQTGQPNGKARPVLSVDATDLAAVTTKLAYFLEGKGYASRG